MSARRLKSAADLARHGLIGARDIEALRTVERRYATGLTPYVLTTIKTGAADPVGRQYIPQAAELQTRPGENPDPIGDDAYSPVKGIVHRYPDRVLFKLTPVCAVYCRYCFRREKTGPGSPDHLSPEDVQAALAYIRENPAIWEVILTGGDPLVLSAPKIAGTLDELEAIEHVQVLRIHTRVPVADPERITEALCAALTRSKPVYMVIHVNHANELTPGVLEALARLRAAGCTLLSQSVLLRGVNDDAGVLEDLFRALVRARIKPYYLHHPDLAPGTAHFRLSIAEGQALLKALRGRVSGLCQPTYMLDIPGGHGKVPLTPCSLLERQGGAGYAVTDYQGNIHHYPPAGGEE